MDGHQATKAIRALGIERSDAVTIPIIALSANAFIDDIQESLDSEMCIRDRAMLNDPEILVMDEPTAGLDPGERVRLRNFISEFSHDRCAFGKLVLRL